MFKKNIVIKILKGRLHKYVYMMHLYVFLKMRIFALHFFMNDEPMHPQIITFPASSWYNYIRIAEGFSSKKRIFLWNDKNLSFRLPSFYRLTFTLKSENSI